MKQALCFSAPEHIATLLETYQIKQATDIVFFVYATGWFSTPS